MKITELTTKKKDVLSIADLGREGIEMILDSAASFQEVSRRDIKKVPTLRGKAVVNLFVEPSTRTRLSFELAAKRLSADVINISKEASSLAKGESLKDTAKTLEALQADLIVLRHPAAGAPLALAPLVKFPVINAGDGGHEHPTQALVDLFTLAERLDSLEGKQVAIVGDIAHSRVARSNIIGFVEMGADVTVVGPPTLIPQEVERLGVSVSYSLDEALPRADVVYLLRLQLERQEQNLFGSMREYSRFFGLGLARIDLMKEGAIIMHPGPVNRGIEIASEVVDSGRTVITSQVENGVAVRMALLYQLIGGGEDE